MTESYESIQADAKGAGTSEWRTVDKERGALSGLYRSLAEDATRSDEYKAERAQEAYEKTRERIEKLAPEARKKMLKSAENMERMSIPRPEGEHLNTSDAERLLLTAHERTRIEGLMNRSKEAAGKSPFGGQPPAAILKREYENGLDEGGPSGGAKARAVVGLVRDLGLDLDSVVDGRRTDHHRSCQADAQAALRRADMVSKHVPEPPASLNKGSGEAGSPGVGTYRSKPMVLGSQGGVSAGNPFGKKRRRAWK